VIVTNATTAFAPALDPSGQAQRMRELAQEFEAVFLAEMLKNSGLNNANGPKPEVS